MKRIITYFIFLGVVLSACAQVKYVFYFIGDGLGVNEMLATEMYRAECEGRIGQKPLLFTTFPYSGMVTTYSRSNGITDSSAAGSALATGKKVNNLVCSMDSVQQPLTTIAEYLHERGWGIGIATTVMLNHATPAAFYAHSVNRNNYYSIGRQAAECGFEFLAGPGFASPTNTKDSTSPNIHTLFHEKGYSLAGGIHQAKEHIHAPKMLLISEHAIAHPTESQRELPYAIDNPGSDFRLRDMVTIGIENLSQHDRFFMMIEGGKIDYACHSNDLATAIGEIADLDSAVQIAYQFYLRHPEETLIVLTSDHETGGMALGHKGYKLHLQYLQYQKCSADCLSDMICLLKELHGQNLQWEQVRQLIQVQTGLFEHIEVTDKEEEEFRLMFRTMMDVPDTDVKTLYKSLNLLASKAIMTISHKANIGWATTSHSGAAVPLFAIGQGAERMAGWHDNTEIAPLILDIIARP